MQTIWRDWLTNKALAKMNLNERQIKSLTFVRSRKRITNTDYRKLTGVIHRTASRDLEDLVRKGVLKKVGATGRSAHYILARKQDINRTNRTSALQDKQDINRTKGRLRMSLRHTKGSRKGSQTAQRNHGKKRKTRHKPDIAKTVRKGGKKNT